MAKARDALAAGRAIIGKLVEQHLDQAQWKQDLTWFDARTAEREKTSPKKKETREVMRGFAFQSDELGLGQYQAFLGALGLQCFEPLVHGREVMTLPHATHAGRRDREPALPQLVGDADLAESRLLDGNRHAQLELDLQLHDLKTEFIHREDKLRQAYLDRDSEIGS
jgi:hypothetical protein